MAALREIAERLEDQGVGTVGTDIFPYGAPDAPDDAIVLFPTGGLVPLRAMGPTTVSERPSFQLMSRSKKVGTARDNLATAHAAIENLVDVTLTDANGESALYHGVYALDEENRLSQDKNHRHRFTRNYQLHKAVSS